MSDINIIPAGLIALLAATAFSLLLLAGLIGCLIYGLSKARRRGEPLGSQAVFPHIVGISVSLACALVVILLLLLTEWTALPSTIGRWLDARVWLWAGAFLLLWPLTAFLWKLRRGSTPV